MCHVRIPQRYATKRAIRFLHFASFIFDRRAYFKATREYQPSPFGVCFLCIPFAFRTAFIWANLKAINDCAD